MVRSEIKERISKLDVGDLRRDPSNVYSLYLSPDPLSKEEIAFLLMYLRKKNWILEDIKEESDHFRALIKTKRITKRINSISICLSSN